MRPRPVGSYDRTVDFLPGSHNDASSANAAPAAAIRYARVNPASSGNEPSSPAPEMTANATVTPIERPTLRNTRVTAVATPDFSAPTLRRTTERIAVGMNPEPTSTVAVPIPRATALECEAASKQ